MALEKGKRLDPHDDPIHDQSAYLNGPLRLRLYKEYGVRGNELILMGFVGVLGDINFLTRQS